VIFEGWNFSSSPESLALLLGRVSCNENDLAGFRGLEKLKPIPEGYHTAPPYLIIMHAAKAIEFYKKAFGTKEMMRMLQPDGRIRHAEIKIGDSPTLAHCNTRRGCGAGRNAQAGRCSGPRLEEAVGTPRS
jgi:hypothetical protein